MRGTVLAKAGWAAGLALTGAPAWAQIAEETAVDQVIVTGQRQAYRSGVPVQDIPQAITLVTEARLDEAGITRLADALDLSAAVTRQNNFGGLWESFAIRGLVGDENNPSGYLVNGFNAGRGFGGPRDASGVERIEILKGPNGALFGRGEPGGSVNIVTKRPSFTRGGAFQATLGSYELRRLEGDLNLPLTEGAAVRIVGFHEAGESFRDTVDFERYGVFPSAFVRISPSTSLTYELEATHQEIPMDRGVLALNGELGVIPQNRFLGEPGDGPITAVATGHQLQLQHDFSKDWSLLLGAGLRDTSLEGLTSDAELAAGRQRLYVDGRTLSREVRFRDYDGDHRVYRAELSGRFEGPLGLHRLIAGVDHDRFESAQFVSGYRPPFLSSGPTPQQGYEIDIFNPVYGRFPRPVLARLTDRMIEQRAWGGYIQDQIRVGERLEVRIGARYDDVSQVLLNRINGVESRQEDTRLSPQAGIVWRMNEAVSLYASYSEGFRANTGSTAAGETFEPEEYRSTEAGVKLDIGGVTGTVSLFKLRKTNILTSDLANPGFSIAVGEAESQGVEVDLAGRAPGDVDFVLSYAFVDAEVVEGAVNANGVPIRPGDRLLNVPKHTFSAQASRDFTLGGRELNLGGGVLHVSERLGEVGTAFELPGYTLVRAFGSLELTERVELSAVVNNLFGETYYVNSYSRLWVAPGAPRNAAVTLRYRF